MNGDHEQNGDHGSTPKPVTGDRLDTLLRAWHDENRTAADALRERVLAAADRERQAPRGVLARIGFLRVAAAAAAIAGIVTLVALFAKNTEKRAFADSGLVQVAEGGALDALDGEGNTLGPCPLQHTDVKVEISGLFARTVVEQTYTNPYPRTIEAVYTFPLSNRAAVDRMTMVVRAADGSEKVIEGEVKERSAARAIYEEARESGYVASLLEQERPNIFTQSVANIEPGATVRVRIASIELARRVNGIAEYVFPMVVGPRYIPGATPSIPALPAGWRVRAGVVLRAPAGVEVAKETPFPAGKMLALLEGAVPVEPAADGSLDELLQSQDAVQFTARYGNGSGEQGTYFPSRSIGEVNGRFYYAKSTDLQGNGFSGDTDQVPDASRITPMPVRPSERAGHDISLRVTLASGGPAITDVASELHAVAVDTKSATERVVSLEDQKSIPNRDFILRWKVADASIEPAFFAHTAEFADSAAKGGYFALMLEPPARIVPSEVRPRELVFVLDTSGSMNGFPIEKSKALARKAIAAMRANDTFNIITFAGATSVLWYEPQRATDENRRLAEQFIEGAYGSGGTEMMTAVSTALIQEGRSALVPARLLDLPADGRSVRIVVSAAALARDARSIAAGNDANGVARSIALDSSIAFPSNPKSLNMLVDGTWETRDGNRVLVARSARFEDADTRTRLVFFLTDGYIGNEAAVIGAVRDNARASRVFTFGIGNSVNRHLLEEMARAGRGVCEVVTLAEEADAVVERLVRRIESPVLTDIELEVSPELALREILPAGEHLPDLYDEEPIVLLGRFDRAATGSITLRGRTGAGAWERTVAIALPSSEPRHDVVPTLWARAKVDQILAASGGDAEDLLPRTQRDIVRLGETYRIATPLTSFVAVEKSRVVVGGRPMLVSVPVELPDGTNWEGFFEDGPAESCVAAFGRGDGRAAQDALEAVTAKARERGLLLPIEAGRGVIGSVGVDDMAEDSNWVFYPAIDSRRAETGALTSGGLAGAAGRPGSPNSGGTGGGGGGAASPPAAARAAPAAPAAPPPPVTASAMPFGSANAPAKALQEPQEQRAKGVAPPGRMLARERLGGTPRDASRREELMRETKSAPSYSRSLRDASGEAGGLRGGGFSGGLPGKRGAGGESAEKFGIREDEKDRGEGFAKEAPSEPAPAADPAATGATGTNGAFKTEDLDRIARVLDERLLVVTLAGIVEDLDSARTLLAELELSAADDGGLLVAMKLDRESFDKSIAALRALGVAIEAEDAARGLLVARIRPDALFRAALVEGVRRIEPSAVAATPAP